MHNNKTREDFLKKIYLSLYLKGCVCERGLETEPRLQRIDLTSPSENSRVSFSFSWTATQPEGRRPTLLGAGFLYRILSPTGLQTQSGVPKAPSAGWWLSIPHLVTDSSDLQLNRGSKGPLLLGGGFLYHILSPSSLTSNSIGGPEIPFCRVVAFLTTSCHQRLWSPN